MEWFFYKPKVLFLDNNRVCDFVVPPLLFSIETGSEEAECVHLLYLRQESEIILIL